MAEARIKARVDADASSVGRELGKATSQAQSFAARMRGIGKGLAGAFTIGAVGAGLKNLISDADRIADLAANIGITTDELQALEATAIESGSSIERLGQSLERLAQAQGNIVAGEGEKAMNALERLGISAEDATAPVGQLFAKIAEGFAKTQDVGALDELFGRGATQLAGTLRAVGQVGGIEKLIELQRASGAILSPGELAAQARLADKVAAAANQARKTVAGFVTPGSEDMGAIQAQKAAIESARQARAREAQAIAEKEASEKRSELEKIISESKPEGLGNELVRIGARGGIQAQESKAVQEARKQLDELRKISKNTEPIKNLEGEATF